MGVLFRKLPCVPMRSRIFPYFLFTRFSLSGFMVRSLIHLSLNFIPGVSMDYLKSSTCNHTVLSIPFVEIPVCISGSFNSNMCGILFRTSILSMCLFLYLFYQCIYPFVIVSVFMTMPCGFYYCGSAIQLIIGKFFHCSRLFGLFWVFIFNFEFENCPLKFYKLLPLDFVGDWIFSMLILQIHEHGIVFHLLVSFSVSSFKDLKF